MSLVAAGSSPRAWGIQAEARHRRIRHRFIPTCVGYTKGYQNLKLPTTVHPHVRGVYFSLLHASLRRSGSSPRAWGIQNRACNARPGCRFIPTCVGYTDGVKVTGSLLPVHPHVRGVYQMELYEHVFYTGSSPRAWGIRQHPTNGSLSGRFIPTCVGYTAFWPGWPCSAAVHPHVRGVYRGHLGQGQNDFRFIPTCVGYTAHASALMIRSAVHPHVRGVYAKPGCTLVDADGSSPRAWGILKMWHILNMS